MKNNKVASFLISGIFLIYFGLEDMDEFNLLYNGLALSFGSIAIIMGIIEFVKEKKKDT
jgi:uncharacterized membrane protein HdeD (DUF308 family)